MRKEENNRIEVYKQTSNSYKNEKKFKVVYK